MKKTISFILCAVLVIFALSSCSDAPVNTNGKLSIVTTIFPEYDWVRNILGSLTGETDLTMLLDTGVDLHNYQPTADDIIKITTCDMFIYVGGESDKWVDEVLKNNDGDKPLVIDLFDVLSERLKEEELKEGMQAEEEEEDEDEVVYDEHIWVSLKNASYICQYIAGKLGEIDAQNKDIYEANAKEYIAKLNSLDEQYTAAISQSSVKTLVFADRFPFRYLTDDYSLDYYAAFIGCSAETEASFETIQFLSKKVDELSLDCVFTLEGSDNRIANTVIQNTQSKDKEIYVLNSMQSTTADQVKDGADYLTIMSSNLEVLKQALK